MLYDIQYWHLCLQFLIKIYDDHNLVQHQNIFIHSQLIQLHFFMIVSEKSTLQMHEKKTTSLNIDWVQMKSNEICFCCIQWMSEITLSCGHIICEICVQNIGDEISAFDSQYQIDTCMLCWMRKLLVKLRFFTVKLWLLNIDGGETLEMIVIEFMNVMQSILENNWRIQNLFNVAYGTSIDEFDNSRLTFALTDMRTGGLVILILFLRQLPVSEYVKMFDILAKQLFPFSSNQTSLLSCLWCVLRLWYHDECHNAETLKSHLQENLDFQGWLFDHIQSLFATKVGVMAAIIDKGILALLTNYNSSGKWDKRCGMDGEHFFPILCWR